MNIALWILCGGAIGWIGFAVFHANMRSGMLASVGIGAAGALAGGMMIAPMLGAATGPENVISPFSLIVALAVATACLIVGNLLSARSGR